MLESKFKSRLKDRLKKEFPGCIIMHLDPTEIQGIPDLIILYNDRWAALEGKRYATAHHQPNQEYYVKLMNGMSYASFIYPENMEVVIGELQQAFTSERQARLPKRV